MSPSRNIRGCPIFFRSLYLNCYFNSLWTFYHKKKPCQLRKKAVEKTALPTHFIKQEFAANLCQIDSVMIRSVRLSPLVRHPQFFLISSTQTWNLLTATTGCSQQFLMVLSKRVGSNSELSTLRGFTPRIKCYAHQVYCRPIPRHWQCKSFLALSCPLFFMN